MLERLGKSVALRPYVFIGAWTVIALVGAIFGGAVFDKTVDIDAAPQGVESMQVDAHLDELDPEGPMVLGVFSGEDFYSPPLVAAAPVVMQRVREVPGVVEVIDAYTAGGLIGDDGRSSLVSVELSGDLEDEDALEVADQVAEILRTMPAPLVQVGGELLGEQEFVDRAVREASIGEAGAILVLIVLLTLMLGRFRVGGVPILAALVAIASALLLMRVAVTVVSVSEFAINIMTILGLGLAVDYSLLVIARFQEERELDPRASPVVLLGRTMAQAGRAVLVSGIAVCIALGGMLVLGDPMLSGMAIGGSVAVIGATAVGLTLVPAIIAVIHARVPARGERRWGRRDPAAQHRRGLLARLTTVAQRRPIYVSVTVTGVLLFMATPLVALTLGSSDIHSLPADTEERGAYESITTGFHDLGVEPVTVIVEAPVSDPDVHALLDEAASLAMVDDARQVPDLPNSVTVVEFTPLGTSTGAEAQTLVRAIRQIDSSLAFAVGGPAAEVVDSVDHLTQRLPFALLFIIGSTFVLLFVLTKSVVVPVKALLLNALTITATLGVLVAIFQWGWASELLGFDPWGALDVTTPLFIGMLAFGLSMDYQVFLLARINEEWRRRDRSLDPREANRIAVFEGISKTGPVVTLAAVAMAIVFLAFALGSLTAMKEVGIGMVVAIVIDVTLIRGLLLPATMTLLGQWNWWRPGRASHPQSEQSKMEALV
ncbi:MMPL family transporter [Demequina aurantiaca]|uniref:MMPL family transporter n=1 Tax=Demequina aurantiaca TaxID=676200 RepID=UPI00078060B9|nr:efflux RND transporter permease subunit [Demequina aurantiaca]